MQNNDSNWESKHSPDYTRAKQVRELIVEKAEEDVKRKSSLLLM